MAAPRIPPLIATLILSLGLVLAGCGSKVNNEPPPRAQDRFVIEPQNSVIAVPVQADLGRLAARLEHEIPRQLWDINKPDQVCVPSKRVDMLITHIKTPNIRCDIVGHVTRGRLTLSGRGQDIIVTMPLHAQVQARDVGGVLKQETATADARVRAVVRLDLTPDWQLRGKADISYDWTDAPHIQFLGQRIEFTSAADRKLQAVMTQVERQLAQEIAALPVRQQIDRAWQAAFTTLELNRQNPAVWMQVVPTGLSFGGYQLDGRKLTVKLGLSARTATFVGIKPDDPPATALPAVQQMAAPAGQFRFALPVVADYAVLEPILARALARRAQRPFIIPGMGPVTARFEQVTIYGTESGKIAVGLKFSAAEAGDDPAHGTVWLTARPVNAANSRRVDFTDLTVTGATDSIGTDLLIDLVNTRTVSAIVAGELGQNFDRDYDKLLNKVSRAIASRRERGLIITSRIDDVQTGSISAAGEGLYLPVHATGTASISLAQ
ncbi:DUF4403 family protein [Altererythrobacter xixiisoli]|uniref:DUF4403 family protein n=1 Tax=Croceibacterium xixiisoli TaxID=1476466 RepID=A0A6I4TQ04_9SPHN|nr:DUF4403 family protein [Croceibacterium xixiisoli]MXO97926.1 DUF4403 family protein [Croceibacterium xixiisoli]